MRPFPTAMIAASLLGLAALTSCGDSFSSGTFPRIEFTVDSQAVEPGGEVFFTQAIQSSIFKEIEIFNPGTETLTITGIDWDTDATGAKLKNRYVEIDWRGSIDASSFPYDVEPGVFTALAFAIKYSPPLGLPLDDFSPSVLLIQSNARDVNGETTLAEVRVTFSIRVDSPFPRVTPSNYKFTNATLAKPERQDFRIYNDEQLATAPFKILGVTLQNPSNEFTLLNLPSNGTEVLAPGDPAYQDVVFTCEYAPKDDTDDTNIILIDTDAGPLSVQLTTGRSGGAYSLTYDMANEFDFTNVSQTETRSVQIFSEGPGPITIREPSIEPGEARQDFSFEAYIPATTPDGTDDLVTSWPRGLAPGRSIRIEVTFEPANDGSDTANGQLIIPYESPEFDEIIIDLFSGQPKSRIALAPATGNVAVTGDALGGETGTRKIVIYNEGNGPLDLQSIELSAAFDQPPKIYSLAQPFSPTMVAPGDLLVVEVDYDLSPITDPDKLESETFAITYFNDFTAQNEEETHGLVAGDAGGNALPIANPGSSSDYAGAVAGELLTLNGAGSSPGAASGIDDNSYVWYLTAKPAGSKAKLNVQAGSLQTFLPDVPGSYTVELFVFVQVGSAFLYSEPASVTFDVSGS